MEDTTAPLHTWNIEDICEYLETDLTTGLSSEVARERLKEKGPNSFTIPEEGSKLLKYFRNCFWGFNITTIISCIISFLIHFIERAKTEIYDPTYMVTGIILYIIFLFSGAVRYLQANDDYEVAYTFSTFLPEYCTVVRNAEKVIIHSSDVVVGDILLLCYGLRIAADVCIFEADNLVVNNVTLSGFSVPIELDPRLVHRDKWVSRNVGFACSHVIKGRGKGIVIACGDDTEVGVMANLSLMPRPRSRARKHIIQVTVFTLFVGIFISFCSLFAVSFIGLPLEYTLLFINGLTIASSPMMLPTLMYFSMKHTRKRMLTKNCYVRNLEATSTLGLTSVICSDMVGTMTHNRMRVSEIYVNNELFMAEDTNWGEVKVSERFKELMRVAVLCNDASVNPGTNGMPFLKKGMSGNDYDIAILKFSIHFIFDIDVLRRSHQRVFNKPYNSMDHLHITIHKTVDEDDTEVYVMLLKGYFILVLQRCNTIAVDDEEIPLDEMLRDNIVSVGHRLQNDGRRVYAFSYKELSGLEYRHYRKLMRMQNSEHKPIDCTDMRFVGIIGAHDPPRANIGNAVAQCRSSGIKLVLITRTHVHFAKAVAKKVGVIASDSETVEDVAQRLNIFEWQVPSDLVTAAVINMADLAHLDINSQRMEIRNRLLCYSDLVFAATNLKQRHMIVDVCQGMGAVVTVIGSGVHDTPAIRKANVGVAKGLSSSHASKACADVILMDDNFATVVNAIEESRLLFENQKKALCYILSSNMPQILAYFLFILLTIPIPVFIYVSFIIDILMDLVPALSLFYEKAETDLMKQAPKMNDDFLINRRLLFVSYFQVGVIEAFAAMTSYFIVMSSAGFFPETLVGLGITWLDEAINDITDSYGQEWTRAARLNLEYLGAAAFLMAIVILQSINLFLVRTGRTNLLYHGFNNHLLNILAIAMICLGFVLCLIDMPQYFCLRLHNFNDFAFCSFDCIYHVIPFGILLVIVESVRRYFLRSHPGGWLEMETYY
ncbi:sodium/potassium-transporting ATPase subunit alpha-like [Scaptodrosophila lebanonensis]|uniref:Sodium/potassium-transporting ATPase subunit alpha-like n=1 Tax=Drosophila lebanonensis TaxID=7225 RepID=A0A6J2T9G6_DROLE|nr:sodium/potassium-transporting ATPase subunit alpha-like [Scaptodrosophila lebanonensis]